MTWLLSLSSLQNSSYTTELEQLIAINSFAITVLCTVVFVSLLYLSYGTYREYLNKKKKAILVVSVFFLTLAMFSVIMFLIAGSFII
jgi:hypothetical protein